MWAKPLKDLAHRMVSEAIRNGQLTRQPCERCGSESDVIAHHEDYWRPLEVVWLCRPHHAQRHQELGWGIPLAQRMARLKQEGAAAPVALFTTEGDLAKACFREDELINLSEGIRQALAIIRCREIPTAKSEEKSLAFLEHFWFELERYLETRDGFLDLEHLRQKAKEGVSGS